MKIGTAVALVSMALGLHLAPAGAVDVYKCGQGYSQQPCPGGQALAVDDSRNDAQKKQAGAVAQRDARQADAMEKARLKQEAQPLSGYISPPQFSPPPQRGASSAMRKPETFIAVAPGEKKKKAEKKVTPKKPAAKAS